MSPLKCVSLAAISVTFESTESPVATVVVDGSVLLPVVPSNSVPDAIVTLSVLVIFADSRTVSELVATVEGIPVMVEVRLASVSLVFSIGTKSFGINGSLTFSVVLRFSTPGEISVL